MVREGDVQIYYEDDLVQAMPLEFTSGGSLYIILPKDGDAVGLLSSMTSEYFYEIQSESTDATGRLLLPRFELQGETIQLNDTLKALGVPLFDEKKAALTGGLVEGEKLVWLSEVKHKAFITVDEKGTTATGATMVMAEAEIADNEPTEPFEMNCNKPFVFVLCANTYDGGSQVLFTGIVNQP